MISGIFRYYEPQISLPVAFSNSRSLPVKRECDFQFPFPGVKKPSRLNLRSEFWAFRPSGRPVEENKIDMTPKFLFVDHQQEEEAASSGSDFSSEDYEFDYLSVNSNKNVNGTSRLALQTTSNHLEKIWVCCMKWNRRTRIEYLWNANSLIGLPWVFLSEKETKFLFDPVWEVLKSLLSLFQKFPFRFLCEKSLPILLAP